MNESDGYDIDNRDPNYINQHLQVKWNDLVAEPDGIRSAKCIWKASYYLFRYSKYCCYTVLTAIFFIPISICIGCNFAFLSFQHIWCVRPFIRELKINCHALRTINHICCDTCLGPFVETIGLVFSRFKFVFMSQRAPNKSEVSNIENV